MAADAHRYWLSFALLTGACAGRDVKPDPGSAVVLCQRGCGANFDALGRGQTSVLVQNEKGRTTAGELTQAGEERARELRKLLEGLSLRERYGCPGCGGGPVAWVELAGARHEYELASLEQSASDTEREALSAASAFIDSIRRSVARCESSEWVRLEGECEPHPEPPDSRDRTLLEKLGPVDPAAPGARDAAETEPGGPQR